MTRLDPLLVFPDRVCNCGAVGAALAETAEGLAIKVELISPRCVRVVLGLAVEGELHRLNG